MNIEEAISQACESVGIFPPKTRAYGKWLSTDTLAGKRGKGDGRVIIDDRHVCAFNWQTGVSETICLRDDLTVKERRQIAYSVRQQEEKRKGQTERAARRALAIIEASTSSTHPYLTRKGFPQEQALVIGADYLRRHVGDYLVCGERAIVMPARIGQRVTSVQLIWEDGTKKFLSGGAISGSYHRIASGRETWLCEGFATGLSLRMALKALNRSAAVMCCFSAGNVAAVARSANRKAFILTDNDKALPQFDGLGTGEHWAREAGKPYLMPPEAGDLNDFHQSHGIFAVQRLITDFLREAR